jgi:hypothetical protein
VHVLRFPSSCFHRTYALGSRNASPQKAGKTRRKRRQRNGCRGTKYRSPYNVLTVHTFGICRLRQCPFLD